MRQLSNCMDFRARPGEPPRAAGPGEVAERLLALREACPFGEAVIWPRLPGMPFGMAVAHLEALAAEVAPVLAGTGVKSVFAVLTVITVHRYRSLTVDS